MVLPSEKQCLTVPSLSAPGAHPTKPAFPPLTPDEEAGTPSPERVLAWFAEAGSPLHALRQDDGSTVWAPRDKVRRGRWMGGDRCFADPQGAWAALKDNAQCLLFNNEIEVMLAAHYPAADSAERTLMREWVTSHCAQSHAWYKTFTRLAGDRPDFLNRLRYPDVLPPGWAVTCMRTITDGIADLTCLAHYIVQKFDERDSGETAGYLSYALPAAALAFRSRRI